LEWGSDRIDTPIRGLRLLILSEDEDGVVAAETEGLGKAGPDESPFDKSRIHMKYVLDTNTLISSFKGFWRNKITRILLVVVFTNLSASLGTFVAIPLMLKVL
jgi:hypothetical protein